VDKTCFHLARFEVQGRFLGYLFNLIECISIFYLESIFKCCGTDIVDQLRDLQFVVGQIVIILFVF
jgi:hypothetical protein